MPNTWKNMNLSELYWVFKSQAMVVKDRVFSKNSFKIQNKYNVKRQSKLFFSIEKVPQFCRIISQ